MKTILSNSACRCAIAIAFSTVLIGCVGQPTAEIAEPPVIIEFSEPASWDSVEGSPAAKTNWFTHDRFGMFIHWGLYSEAAGEWKGERYYGITEWLMRRSRETTAEYSTLAERFNPTEYDAEEWVAIAKAAGVKYIVITSKHHDGFALFDTAVSEFDIVDATPFGRDALKELADAAAAEGIKLGFYYSQFQDWTEPNAGGNDWEFDEDEKDFTAYLEGKAMPQIDELLTNYGDVGLIWFDTPGDITKEAAEALADRVNTLQPDALVSSRIGHDLGDFRTLRDAEIPAAPIVGEAWEAIFTHNDSWGYSSFDNNFKSTSALLEKLSTIASMNGNFMLNVGPDGLGRLPKGATDRFLAMGEWLDVNGQAIYGTRGSPVGPVPWGAITHRPGTLYGHVFNRPDATEILLPYVTRPIEAIGFLETGEALAWRQDGQDVYITLPQQLPDARNSIIRIEYEGVIEDNNWDVPTLLSADYDVTTLSSKWADLTGAAEPAQGRYYTYFGDWKYYDWIDGLRAPSDTAAWSLRVTEPGEYRVTLKYAANEESARREGFVEVGDQQVAFRVLQTADGTGNFPANRPLPALEHTVGTLTFEATGTYDLVLRPREAGSRLMTLTKITLEPVD